MSYDSKQDTLNHIKQVQINIGGIITELQERSICHDQSKLHDPEKPVFDEYTPKLKGSTYGSKEYKTYLAEMKPALDHHYFHNRHHPEYFIMGEECAPPVLESPLERMNLVDIVEMLCDWLAATKRHDDGDIMKSIEINQKRFGYGDELKEILKNTASLLRLIEKQHT